MDNLSQVTLTYVNQYSTYANVITAFSVTQIVAFLLLLLQSEPVRAGYRKPVLVITTVILMIVFAVVYIYGVGFCHNKELTLLKEIDPSALERLRPTISTIMKGQSWVIAVFHLLGVGGVVAIFFRVREIGIISH